MNSPRTVVDQPPRDWTAIPIEKIADGIERQMIWGERVMVCRLRFAPHVVTPVHAHAHEQITLVEQGRVLFTIDRNQRVVTAGDVLHFPSGVPHGATILDEEVVLIDIFSPIREDFLDARPSAATAAPSGREGVDGDAR